MSKRAAVVEAYLGYIECNKRFLKFSGNRVLKEEFQVNAHVCSLYSVCKKSARAHVREHMCARFASESPYVFACYVTGATGYGHSNEQWQ